MMRSSSATRSSREVCEYVSNALRAALTAASTSSAVPRRILPTACSVAGLMTSSSRRPAGLTHAPSMKNFLKSYMGILRRGRSNDTSATHVGLLFRQQQLHVGDARQVEIARNRVLQAGGRRREVDGLLRIEIVNQAVQDAGSECV